MSSIFNSNSVLLSVLTGLACSWHSVSKMKSYRKKEGFGQVLNTGKSFCFTRIPDIKFFSFCMLKTRHKTDRRRSSGTRGRRRRRADRNTSGRRTATRGTSGRRRRRRAATRGTSGREEKENSHQGNQWKEKENSHQANQWKEKENSH